MSQDRFSRAAQCAAGKFVSNFLLISITFSPVKPPAASSDRLEVVVLPARQGPVKHACRRVADVLEAMDDVARDEDEGAGTGRRGLVADGHLIGALDDEEDFFLVGMNMVGRAFAGLVPAHDDRRGAAGGLGAEEHFHVEPEGLDRQRMLGLDDCSFQRCVSCVHM
jgi:hypothetical protein